MQTKSIMKNQIEKKHFTAQNLDFRKVDINVLLNRVKIEKKNAIKKNFLITVGAVGTLAVTGLITIL